MARAPNFDLVEQLGKPSFTPGARDAPALVELVAAGDDSVVTRAAPALARLGSAGREAVLARLTEVETGAQVRLVAVLGLIARGGDAHARAVLISQLGDSESRVRRAGIVALGKLTAGASADAAGLDEVRASLLARWDAGDAPPDERRALAEALGKLGGDDALARLRALDASADKELARRRDRAVLMADRTSKRDAVSTIATDVPPPQPITVRLTARPALAELLFAELRALGLGDIRQRGESACELALAQPWSALFASRLWAGAAIRVPLVGTGELADSIIATITSPAIRDLFRAWTQGPVRWRLGFTEGHKRSIVWRVARDVTARAPELINDPARTTWDILVDDRERMLEVVPRRADDPRFAYRSADVPAASHPSVAAALAWVAAPGDGDLVWDPFCGSGVELIECARRAKVRALGTDIDPAALDAARANLAAAGVTAELTDADARRHTPGTVDAIVTNPPLGSRVQLDAPALLCAALPNLARALTRGGRLVWITPAATRTGPVAERLGLRLARTLPVDLGGVRGRLERWERA